ESGAPYFREAVDQGLHFALSELNWRSPDEPGVSRWIIVAGDAPPYPDGSQARHADGSKVRQHSDQQLIDLAREKQIAIYGMALGTQLGAVAELERPDLKMF